jgi:hypothetical protein
MTWLLVVLSLIDIQFSNVCIRSNIKHETPVITAREPWNAVQYWFLDSFFVSSKNYVTMPGSRHQWQADKLTRLQDMQICMVCKHDTAVSGGIIGKWTAVLVVIFGFSSSFQNSFFFFGKNESVITHRKQFDKQSIYPTIIHCCVHISPATIVKQKTMSSMWESVWNLTLSTLVSRSKPTSVKME